MDTAIIFMGHQATLAGALEEVHPRQVGRGSLSWQPSITELEQ